MKLKYPVLQDIENWAKRMAAQNSPIVLTAIRLRDNLLANLEAVWKFGVDLFLPLLVAIADGALAGVSKILQIVIADFLDMLTAMKKVYTFLNEDLYRALFGEAGLGPMLGWLIDNFLNKFNEKIDNISRSIEGLTGILHKLAAAINALPLKKLDPITGNSPSPLAVGIETANAAMQKMDDLHMPRFRETLTKLPQVRPLVQPSFGGAGFAPGLAGVGADQSVSVSIQGVTINNGMDLAYFEDRVSKAVTRSTRNG